MSKFNKPPDIRRFFADPKRRQELCKLLAIDASRADAAKKLGVTRRTIWNECDRDAGFKRAVEQAEAEGKIALITCISNAAAKDWRAGFAMLQAKYFEWSRSAHDATKNSDLVRAHRLLGEQLRVAVPPEHHAAVQTVLDTYLENLLGCGEEGGDDDGD